MILLLKFDRNARRIVARAEYEDADRDSAVRDRLSWEIETVLSGRDYEVVLLEAPTEKQIRQTHGRYFETFEELGARLERSFRK